MGLWSEEQIVRVGNVGAENTRIRDGPRIQEEVERGSIRIGARKNGGVEHGELGLLVSGHGAVNLREDGRVVVVVLTVQFAVDA